MIIIDENVDQTIVDALVDHNYKVYSIRETHPGIDDRRVIEIVKKRKGILITEDKDFGELVFSHNQLIRNKKHQAVSRIYLI